MVAHGQSPHLGAERCDRACLGRRNSASRGNNGFSGNTLAQIAGEKAGILKPGVPFVVGRQEAEAFRVIEARAWGPRPSYSRTLRS